VKKWLRSIASRPPERRLANSPSEPNPTQTGIGIRVHPEGVPVRRGTVTAFRRRRTGEMGRRGEELAGRIDVSNSLRRA
jgi:hypothetical protein